MISKKDELQQFVSKIEIKGRLGWEVSYTWEGDWKILAYHFTKNGNCIFDRTTTLEVK